MQNIYALNYNIHHRLVSIVFILILISYEILKIQCKYKKTKRFDETFGLRHYRTK